MDEATITPYRDGPLLVRGPFKLLDQDGNEIDAGRATVALCPCAKSRLRPFCDRSHTASRFRAAAAPVRRRRAQGRPLPRPERARGRARAGLSPPLGGKLPGLAPTPPQSAASCLAWRPAER